MAMTLHYDFATDKSLVARLGPTLGITRTTDATYFDSDGVLQTAASGAARFDHDPATSASLGLFVEEQRINVALHNRDSTNAAWVKSNMTAAKDQIGEDLVINSASSLLATDANATAIQAFTILSAAQTGTFSIKRLIGTGDVDITVDDGATWATVTINSLTYTRFAVTQTLANPDIGVRLVTSGDKIAIDFQGLEAGAFATSRIATTTLAVTRNKDQFNSTDVSWFNSVEGTIYTKSQKADAVSATNIIVDISDGTSGERMVVRKIADDQLSFAVRESASNQAVLTDTAAYTLNVPVQNAAAYKVNDFEHYVDGTRVGTGDQAGNVPVGVSEIDVGQNASNTEQFNGHIAEIRYYDSRLPNEVLEGISNGIFPGGGAGSLFRHDWQWDKY